MSKESYTSFIKIANLFQPILVVVISIVGGTPMEGSNKGKIILLVILGAAFIIWHVECRRLISKNREKARITCLRKRQSAVLYKKVYTSLSEEYGHFADSLNRISYRIACRSNAGAREWSFRHACLFLCSTIAGALAEYKKPLIVEVLYIKAEHQHGQTCLHVAGYAQGENNDDIPSILGQPPRPVTDAPALLDEQLFAEHHLSPVILSSPAEIGRSFFRKRNQPPEEKYMQYIAIPVLCNRSEIVGLIEVVVKKAPFVSPLVMLEDYELADVKSWLYHLKNHFLLFHQTEKILSVLNGQPAPSHIRIPRQQTSLDTV